MVYNTIKGPIDASLLTITAKLEDNPGEYVVSVEYRLGDELVRRDAHLILKDAGVVAQAIAADFDESKRLHRVADIEAGITREQNNID